jgi:chaperonin GroES
MPSAAHQFHTDSRVSMQAASAPASLDWSALAPAMIRSFKGTRNRTSTVTRLGQFKSWFNHQPSPVTNKWRTLMKFRPLHDRVVVERIEADAKSSGGIIIPDTVQEKPSQGEIIAIGPGGRDESGKLIPIDLKVGDRVLFGKWSGTEIKLDGVDYLIMKESDVMGVVEQPAAKKKAA